MRHLADIRDGNGSKRNKSFPCSKKEDSAVFRRLLVVKPMPTVYRYKGFRLHFYSDEGHDLRTSMSVAEMMLVSSD
jgi:hypothetical protein